MTRKFFIVAGTLLFFLAGCRRPDFVQIVGETMGTYYNIQCAVSDPGDLQSEIDSILLDINLEVSPYIDSSFISKFNQTRDTIDYRFNGQFPVHFDINYEMARKVYEKSSGAFDPTVMPLVNYWGFGYQGGRPFEQIDTLKIDSLMEFVGFDKIVRTERPGGKTVLTKQKPGIQLDFSALAKGYALDVIAQFFDDKGWRHYMIDIGGEIRVRGKNRKGQNWVIGINQPDPGAALTEIILHLSLTNISAATSGNYRNFYELDGEIISHTINPRSGFPERSRLVSSTVIAPACMVADAYATAFMVLGLEESLKLVENLDSLEALFIYVDEEGRFEVEMSSGFDHYIME